MNIHKQKSVEASNRFQGQTQMEEFTRRQADAKRQKELRRNKLVDKFSSLQDPMLQDPRTSRSENKDAKEDEFKTVPKDGNGFDKE